MRSLFIIRFSADKNTSTHCVIRATSKPEICIKCNFDAIRMMILSVRLRGYI